MEFTITCPIDGPITVSIEDIDTVVLREPQRAEISFVCPDCGTLITVEAVIPAFLLAAMQELAEESDGEVPVSRIVALVSDAGIAVDDEPDEVLLEERDDPRADAYCEYFRRQLDRIVYVEDMLSEIDANR